jgi:hypothetical protein
LPHRWRQFKLSNDPKFVDMLRDVVASMSIRRLTPSCCRSTRSVNRHAIGTPDRRFGGRSQLTPSPLAPPTPDYAAAIRNWRFGPGRDLRRQFVDRRKRLVTELTTAAASVHLPFPRRGAPRRVCGFSPSRSRFRDGQIGQQAAVVPAAAARSSQPTQSRRGAADRRPLGGRGVAASVVLVKSRFSAERGGIIKPIGCRDSGRTFCRRASKMRSNAIGSCIRCHSARL